MAKSADMFAELKPPRASPRVLMHHNDVGVGTYGYVATFACPKCGKESDLMHCDTQTDVRRGIPCPDCNHDGEVRS